MKRQNMFIWFLINTLHYNQMERKNVEILVHLTFNCEYEEKVIVMLFVIESQNLCSFYKYEIELFSIF